MPCPAYAGVTKITRHFASCDYFHFTPGRCLMGAVIRPEISVSVFMEFLICISFRYSYILPEADLQMKLTILK